MQGKHIRESDPFMQGLHWPLIVKSLLQSNAPTNEERERVKINHTHTYTD